MPLAEEYEESMKNKITDLKNIWGAVGGSITAAIFLTSHILWTRPSGPTFISRARVGRRQRRDGYGPKTLSRWVGELILAGNRRWSQPLVAASEDLDVGVGVGVLARLVKMLSSLSRRAIQLD